MTLIDYLAFVWAIFLLVIGLILEASGFGILVTGRIEGLVLIIIGVTMFWGGWVASGARGFSCVVAAVLNMFDAALTVALWNFEANPVVIAAGPTIFMISKVACSLTIMLYAKLEADPRKGGIALAAFFAFIVAWNLSQRMLLYSWLQEYAFRVVLVPVLSFAVSAAILYALLKSEIRRR